MSSFYRLLSLIAPLIILAASSLLILQSVAPAQVPYQLAFFVASIVIIVVLSRIDYQLFTFSPWPWYGLANFLLAITMIMGVTSRGSTRWINLFGIQFQTSEVAKPLLLLFTAIYLADHRHHTAKGFLKYILVMVPPFVLIFLQPDLGSAIMIGMIALAAVIAAGVNFRYLAIGALIVILSFPVVLNFMKPYQRDRIEGFANPAIDPLGTGYNSIQASIAVGSGKLFGRGLGQGTQSHLRFLPERHTDFVFASFVEELGFVGGALLIACYIWLARSLIVTAKFAATEAGSIIALSTLFIILFQAGANIAMNMGIAPITGITLPLVSAGGSSVISTAILLGLCISVSLRPAPQKPVLEIR